MSVAYIISAYKLPQLLVRLVHRLAAHAGTILIHVDAKTSPAVFGAMAEPLAGLGNVRFLERHECYWGDFGHVRASLKGLRALVDSGDSFDYVALLTGQDYPLRRDEEIVGTLARSGGAVFTYAMPIPSADWTDGGLDRIEHRHFRIGARRFAFPGRPLTPPALDAAWSALARGLRLYRRFPAGMQPYGGSSYWIFPADCARYVDAYARAHPSFVRFFHHVHVPDEIFFNTVVMNSPFRTRVAADDLRYEVWREGSDSPNLLTMADYDAMRDSGKLFARKFDPAVDAAVLDRLDAVAAAAR